MLRYISVCERGVAWAVYSDARRGSATLCPSVNHLLLSDI